MHKYDYLLVGAGLFNAVIAHEATKAGKRCLVIDKRSHIGGNCYTKQQDGIDVHVYGAHIFRTSNKEIWEYMQQFCEFNHFVNSPVAFYNDEVYNLPFNMNTFSKMWGIKTPEQAKAIIEAQAKEIQGEPKNLEEHVISMVGRDIYEKLVKGYTEKQWGKPCTELPASIMRRIPVRFIYDNNYFHDPLQGIPSRGYTEIFEQMFNGCDVELNTDFLENKERLCGLADKVIFTGTIDAYFDYCEGSLEYRSLHFEHKTFDTDNYQGVAVVNYTDSETPYTRSIEHKHFNFGKQDKTIVSWEYPSAWSIDKEPYYPMEDEANRARYEKYRQLATQSHQVIFGGRLGSYRYYDMQDTIKAALGLAKQLQV